MRDEKSLGIKKVKNNRKIQFKRNKTKTVESADFGTAQNGKKAPKVN